jgi:hypothetical protein
MFVGDGGKSKELHLSAASQDAQIMKSCDRYT